MKGTFADQRNDVIREFLDWMPDNNILIFADDGRGRYKDHISEGEVKAFLEHQTEVTAYDEGWFRAEVEDLLYALYNPSSSESVVQGFESWKGRTERILTEWACRMDGVKPPKPKAAPKPKTKAQPAKKSRYGCGDPNCALCT